LLHIIRLKDNTFANKEQELKSGWLNLKGHSGMTRRYFSLRGFLLYFKKKETDEAWENRIDLKTISAVSRQRSFQKENTPQKYWPIKLVLGEGGAEQGFIQLAADTKDERKSWFVLLAASIAHLRYVRQHETNQSRKVRLDLRVLNACTKDHLPALVIDQRPLTKEAISALAAILPAHDELELLSLSGSSLSDTAIQQLAQPLTNLHKLRSLNLSNNHITTTDELVKILVSTESLTEINLANNQISQAGADLLAQSLTPTIHKVILSGNRASSVSVNADKFVF